MTALRETELGALLEFAAEVGYQLQTAGGEIYRVEESVSRLLAAYGAEGGEVFAIPNCIIVSLAQPGQPAQTRVRRVGAHGTDIYRLEEVNALCRRLCALPLPLEDARRALSDILEGEPRYPVLVRLAAYFVGAAMFALFFGGTLWDGLCAGLCGVAVGGTQLLMERLHANTFIRTIFCGGAAALLALFLVFLGVGDSVDLITIGAIMSLVPGVALTNAIRDIMVGDMVSGISKLGEAVLVATAIALGTGVALWLAPWMGGGAG